MPQLCVYYLPPPVKSFSFVAMVWLVELSSADILGNFDGVDVSIKFGHSVTELLVRC